MKARLLADFSKDRNKNILAGVLCILCTEEDDFDDEAEKMVGKVKWTLWRTLTELVPENLHQLVRCLQKEDDRLSRSARGQLVEYFVDCEDRYHKMVSRLVNP
jgi:hypothetical protein